MKIENIVFLIVVLLSVVSITYGVVYYNVQKDDFMHSNIESAIVKGIDPVAVKCAYGYADSVCAVYVATKK